jgi:pimeloyl-ACP methyl ester carboxylesterase
MAPPRILLVPSLTEIEWRIRDELGEWAEVASYDAPGVGEEPASDQLDLRALERRGLEELERLGWRRCVIAGDEYGGIVAAGVAAERPERVAGFAFGHACLSSDTEGERAPVQGEVMSAMGRLARTDYRSFARALTQITRDAYDDELADEYILRVPQEVTLSSLGAIFEGAGLDLERKLRRLDCPLLFAKHDGCIGWTDEGYEDAIAAFPQATTFSTELKPSVDPEYAQVLREFCEGLDWEDA